MTAAIVLFLACGACFGLATFSHRHLFSEGPSHKPSAADDTLAQRAIWVCSCSALWPLMALMGLLSLWKLRRVPVKPRDPRR